VRRSAVLVLAACAACSTPARDAGDAAPRRRPDGVSIDPPAALPPPVDQAGAGEAVVTLRTPIGSDAALELLHAYVLAILGEDLPAMRALHTEDAAFVSAPPGQPPRAVTGASNVWERRFGRLDYGVLAGTVLVREGEATVRKIPEGVEPVLPAAGDDEGAPPSLRGAELVVRAPIATSRAGGQSLMGSELVLYLRRDGGSWRVSAVVEDFAIP
jgi:hypothetical protein